jgi:hypothetical protein
LQGFPAGIELCAVLYVLHGHIKQLEVVGLKRNHASKLTRGTIHRNRSGHARWGC